MGVFAGPEVVEDGLVLALDAGNTKSYPGSGTTWTDLIGSNNGTLTNMDGANLDSANGGSLTFDGSNEYVSGSIPLTSPYNTTLECWVKVTKNTNGSFFSIGQSANGYLLGIGASAESGAGNLGSPGSQFIVKSKFSFTKDTTYTFPNNGWYHLVVTLGNSNSEWVAYVNGSPITSLFNPGGGSQFTQGINSSFTSVFFVGASSTTNGNPQDLSQAAVTKCHIYSRALTASEIKQNFNALRGRFGI